MPAPPRNTSPVISLSCGDYQAEIATWGGGPKALTWRGSPLLETYPDGEFPPLSAGVVLAPWPNRIADGQFSFKDTHVQLEINEPERNNAIHGFVHEQLWEVAQQTDDRAVLTTRIKESRQWPWPIALTADYRLASDGLNACFTAKGSKPEAPFAFGLHTYLNAQGAPLDESVLEVHVDKQLPLDARKLPCADFETPAFDLERLPMRDVLLDDCFRTTQGTVRLTSNGCGVEMRCSTGLRWFQIFTPDPSWCEPYPGRGRSVAVEPMSAPPNALVTGMDLATLRAGSPITHRVHITAAS